MYATPTCQRRARLDGKGLLGSVLAVLLAPRAREAASHRAALLLMASVSSSWTVAWLLILTLTPLGEGGKLLVVLQDGGQWPSLSPLVKELGQRGHQVVLLVPDISIVTGPPHAYTVKTYSVPHTKEYWESKVKSISRSILKEDSFLEQILPLYQRIVNMTQMMLSACRHLLDDLGLLQSLQEGQFDVLLMDPMFPCGQIVAEYLSRPSVFFSRTFPCGFNHEAAQCPGPSFISPRLFTGRTHHMDFTQRLKYMLVALPEWWLCHELYASYELLASRRLERKVTYQELISSASLWLLRADFVYELPRLVTPNIVLIGGITCAGKKPLSQVGGQSTKLPANPGPNLSLLHVKSIQCPANYVPLSPSATSANLNRFLKSSFDNRTPPPFDNRTATQCLLLQPTPICTEVKNKLNLQKRALSKFALAAKGLFSEELM
ncbi:UDP-glucuronosyltransferase 1A1-like [Lissotriton helveticus]